jgi:hypothetical protein
MPTLKMLIFVTAVVSPEEELGRLRPYNVSDEGK